MYAFSKDGVFIGGNNVFHIVELLSFVERWKDHPEMVKALEDELQDVIDRHVFLHPLKEVNQEGVHNAANQNHCRKTC